MWLIKPSVDERDGADIGGIVTTLGAKEGATGLPTATWSLKNFTVDQYNALFSKIVDGTVKVDNQYPADMSTATFSNVTLKVI